jgi:hypothetical protein
MCSVPDVADALRSVLHDKANALARSSGFVQRASKLTGALLVQTLVFTWLSQAQATLEPMAQTGVALGLVISAQGLEQRFTQAAATLVQQVLEAALATLVQAGESATPLLARFAGVGLFESTCIALPDSLAALWKGCGRRVEQGSAAALKVQVVLDLRHGRLNGCLQAGRAQDRSAPTQAWQLPAGVLKIADLGFFSVPRLAWLHQQGVYFLSRIQVETRLCLQNEFIDLVKVGALLRQHKRWRVDCPILLASSVKLACRLLAVRMPEEVAQERPRRLHFQAGRKGQPVSQARLALADWNLCVTNVPEPLLSLDEALVLLRARWQIALLFKLWKSVGQVDQTRSHKEGRVLCEGYAKLLGVLVQHWLFLVSCWQYPDRSLVKATQTVARYALWLAASWSDRAALEAAIERLVALLSKGCRMNKRLKRPSNWQLLMDPPPRGGLA